MKSICVHPVTSDSDWQKEFIKKAIELWFTVRTIDTFEPNNPLSVSEMYIVVKRLNEYSQVHNTCELEPLKKL
jgi:hypothetical protein